MTVYNAVADLGWTVGSNITTQLASFLSGTATAGDTLRLDTATRFQITRASGQLSLPNNFTLSAVNGGGFTIPSITGWNNSSDALFRLTTGCTLDNITVRFTGAPETGFSGSVPTSGVDFLPATFCIIDGTDTTIRNCDLDSHIESWVRLLEGSHRPYWAGSRFRGGKYTTYWIGNIEDGRVFQCYFEDALIDAIKTINAGNTAAEFRGPRTVTSGLIAVEDTAFVDCNRDGIDTTGGIFGWTIKNCDFIRCGLDLKCPIKELTTYTSAEILAIPSSTYGNHNILVDDCRMVDGAGVLLNTITTDTKSGTAISIDAYNHVNPTNIIWRNIQYWRGDATGTRFALLKGGNEVRAEGVAVQDYTGTFSVFSEGYDAGGGLNGDAPAGWSPPTAPVATGLTQTASGDPQPSPVWTKVEDPATGFVLTTGGVPLLIKPGRGLGRLI